MKSKIHPWKTTKEVRKKLRMYLEDAKKYRENLCEHQWITNELCIYMAAGILQNDIEYNGAQASTESLVSALQNESVPVVGVNYAFKNYRYIHAQLSANPPSVTTSPTSSDLTDRNAADAADRLVRHATRAYKLPEVVDLTTAKTLLYGTGWIKTEFDEMGGDLINFDEKTGEVSMDGDISITSPSVWDVWIDPHAKSWDQVRFVIQRVWYPEEEVMLLFPNGQEVLEKYVDKLAKEGAFSDRSRYGLEERVIPIYHYYEKGRPCNGMGGRYVPFLEDGTPLDDVKLNPFRFTKPLTDLNERKQFREAFRAGKDYELGAEIAYLPFHILTDIDVTDQVYGKSFVDYAERIQDTLNRLDSATLDNVQAHIAIQMVVSEDTTVSDDSSCDIPYEIIKLSGSRDPHYIQAPQQMPEAGILRDKLKVGGDDVAGVNENMFGQQSREQSGFSMQFATNQGNLIRRRLFNKYVFMVEDVYKGYLNLVRKHWKTPKTIQVLGREKSFEVIDLMGADIEGGFDLQVEYGRSFSLDPTTRREEIMQLMPIFEKYKKLDGTKLVDLLKLNEIEPALDIGQQAGQRQREEIDIMVKTGQYVEPQEMQEHQSRLQELYIYLESAEFRDLPKDLKALVIEHTKQREQLSGKQLAVPTAQEANAGANPPGPGVDVQAADLGMALPADGGLDMAAMQNI